MLGAGLISRAFKQRGVTTFEEACNLVQSLEYRRNSTKDDFEIVLKESCGTCSSKHQLIKKLAEENEILDCKLILCMFKMSDLNTPKIAVALKKYGLNYIPEAHTYITINGQIKDLTFPEGSDMTFLEDVLYEEEISADQIRYYKEETHKAYLKEWRVSEKMELTFEELWGVREECIGLLSC
ncbi:MAG: hypothetical protein AAGA77_20365 [Bacteroidota bacterium]